AGFDYDVVRFDPKARELRRLDMSARCGKRIQQCRLEYTILDDVTQVGLTYVRRVKPPRAGRDRRAGLVPDPHALIRIGPPHRIPGTGPGENALARTGNSDDTRIQRRMIARHIRPVR